MIHIAEREKYNSFFQSFHFIREISRIEKKEKLDESLKKFKSTDLIRGTPFLLLNKSLSQFLKSDTSEGTFHRTLKRIKLLFSFPFR